jgi:hypothetical protein
MASSQVVVCKALKNRGDRIRTCDLLTPSQTRYPGCATPRFCSFVPFGLSSQTKNSQRCQNRNAESANRGGSRAAKYRRIRLLRQRYRLATQNRRLWGGLSRVNGSHSPGILNRFERRSRLYGEQTADAHSTTKHRVSDCFASPTHLWVSKSGKSSYT